MEYQGRLFGGEIIECDDVKNMTITANAISAVEKYPWMIRYTFDDGSVLIVKTDKEICND